MIVSTTTLALISSSKSAYGVIRFRPITPTEMTNLVTGESYDLFKSLPTISNINNNTYASLTCGDETDIHNYGPYCFENLHMFENKIITRIRIPIYHIINSDAYFTVYVISNTKGTLEIHQTHRLRLSEKDITNFNAHVGEWVTFSNLNIHVSEGETLAFGSGEDTVLSLYARTKYPGRGFYGCGSFVNCDGNWWDLTNEDMSLMFGIYGVKNIGGKSISILGDSISTYQGYSNNINYNSTIGSNAVAYPDIYSLDVNDTWWMQTINQLCGSLCFNNSWSGLFTLGGWAESSGWYSRCTQLHNDNLGTMPNIIAVYMGTNDFYNTLQNCNSVTNDLFTRIENGALTTPTTFDEAYALMIYKIVIEYGAYSDIFCFTVPKSEFKNFNCDEIYNRQSLL